ncbi:MAG TPA: RnfABCDGE type electron transport complex subunit G [Flavobacteriales bacterium]|jgi:electron transport complex protein RnfG|nr:RnfABCDGE type electron transport complex subunit G [Flavobacteriales bacterium]
MKIKSIFLQMILSLTGIALVAAFALGYVYEFTKGPILKAQIEKQMRAIEAVIEGEYSNDPLNENYKVAFEPDDSLTIYPAKNNEVVSGIAVKAITGLGYSGEIGIMVGYRTDGSIFNIQVLDHKETPGLGTKMTEPKFYEQFMNKNPSKDDLRVTKDGGTIDAIAGATITSRAYCDAVNKAYAAVNDLNDEERTE